MTSPLSEFSFVFSLGVLVGIILEAILRELL